MDGQSLWRCFSSVFLACGVASALGMLELARAQSGLPITDPPVRLALAPETAEPAAGTDDDSELDLDALLDEDITTLRRTSVAPALDVEVSTVSRQKSTIGRSPAAVYVVTSEMIKRSGARNIPDALRLVPGLHVAHMDGNKWAISSRGFGGRFSNKLLVQIDGRTVYTPLFAGVFWDIQDMLLDDVLRIEVIRGPGATVWGANAVNGVINIITKSAAETHGTLVQVGAGDIHEGFAGGRVGGRTEAGIDWRLSGTWSERDHFFEPNGVENDHFNYGRINFRADWNPTDCDTVMVQSSYYNGTAHGASNAAIIGLAMQTVPLQGGHVLGRWTRRFSEDADTSLQLYYDNTNRKNLGFDQNTETFDIDYQSRFLWREHHRMIWGLGYRLIADHMTNDLPPFLISTNPDSRTVQRFSGFIQDEISLIDDKLYLTLGTKLSHNTFSNFEVQPNARLLWLPNESSAVWGSIARAVRTPARTSVDLVLLSAPSFFLYGDKDATSEDLLAYEIGYRQQTTETFAWDLAAFYNRYDDLHNVGLFVPPAVIAPEMRFFQSGYGDAYGFEITATKQVTCNWNLRGWYSYLASDFQVPPAAALQSAASLEGNSPVNQVSLMSSWNLGCCRQFDIIARYVDNVPTVNIPNYITLDARFSCRPWKNVEATVVGQNLLDGYHPEYGSNQFTRGVSTEVPRGVYGMLEFRH